LSVLGTILAGVIEVSVGVEVLNYCPICCKLLEGRLIEVGLEFLAQIIIIRTGDARVDLHLDLVQTSLQGRRILGKDE
jgi:hypothetical protein